MNEITYEIIDQRTIGTDLFVDICVYRDGHIVGTESIQYYFDAAFERAVYIRLQKYVKLGGDA